MTIIAFPKAIDRAPPPLLEADYVDEVLAICALAELSPMEVRYFLRERISVDDLIKRLAVVKAAARRLLLAQNEDDHDVH
jgi:hypothetical protein